MKACMLMMMRCCGLAAGGTFRLESPYRRWHAVSFDRGGRPGRGHLGLPARGARAPTDSPVGRHNLRINCLVT